MKKNVLILGDNGMLGNSVKKEFLKELDIFNIKTTNRNNEDTNSIMFDATNPNQLNDILIKNKFDYIINCIGVIKPFMKNNQVNAIKVNSLFPHIIGDICLQHDSKLINITTDCVYSGKKGYYIESDLHDCLDDYGKTKSLGEDYKNSMVLRTSIVGEEIDKFASLISWVKSMKNKEVNGFNNHLWNGITTNYYGFLCKKIIKEDLYKTGLYHIFSNKDVTKFEMLNIFNEKWNLNLKINEIEATESVNRTLRTEKDLCSKLEIPSFIEMIKLLN